MGLFGSTQSEEEKRQKDLEKLAKETAESNKKIRLQELKEKIDQYKPSWDKNGSFNTRMNILQFYNECGDNKLSS